MARSGGDFGFLIVRPENGGVFDLFKFLVLNNHESGAKFLESSYSGELSNEKALADAGGDGNGNGNGNGNGDHRWVIFVSIVARKIIKVLGKPMEWIGYFVEFILNLLSLNGNLLGLLIRTLQGNVEMPKRDTETFISAIGHLDGRVDLYHKLTSASEVHEPTPEKIWQVEMGDRDLMDLCMMASKLSYENAKVVRNVVDIHWKMNFVEFLNCWDDYQKDNSTQVFIMCDKPEDANLILISFRGTEPFDADDWITDFDYSWYEIPKLGKVHMGFLEALGLGDRMNTNTFQDHLLAKTADTENIVPVVGEMTAYYAVRMKLKKLLKEHKNAKFVVTGHSLGGALAILFPTVLVMHGEGEVMKRLLGVYTYGQPRVGNRQLGRFMENHLDSKYFRVVYCNDLVPRLPYDDKTFLYKHFGRCLYYNSMYIEQSVHEEPNKNYFSLRFLIPDYLNAGWELFRSLIIGYVCGSEYRESWESFCLRMIGLLIPGFAAHSPVDYVNSIRLGRMKKLQNSIMN